jgi:hypothetical protein
VGNARDEDKYLVIGDGGVQLIDASLWALTQGDNVNKSMHVFAQPVSAMKGVDDWHNLSCFKKKA